MKQVAPVHIFNESVECRLEKNRFPHCLCIQAVAIVCWDIPLPPMRAGEESNYVLSLLCKYLDLEDILEGDNVGLSKSSISEYRPALGVLHPLCRPVFLSGKTLLSCLSRVIAPFCVHTSNEQGFLVPPRPHQHAMMAIGM